MKTKTDYTFMIFCIALSLIFFIPFFMNGCLLKSKGEIYFIFLGLILILLGLWSYQYYHITDKYIKKYNLGGLYSRIYQLDGMISFQSKNYNMEQTPVNMLSFFVKNGDRYLIFNKLTFVFENDLKLRIDERFIPEKDFKNLKERLKKELEKNRKNKNLESSK